MHPIWRYITASIIALLLGGEGVLLHRENEALQARTFTTLNSELKADQELIKELVEMPHLHDAVEPEKTPNSDQHGLQPVCMCHEEGRAPWTCAVNIECDRRAKEYCSRSPKERCFSVDEWQQQTSKAARTP